MITSIKMHRSDFMWHVVWTRADGVSSCVAVDTVYGALKFAERLAGAPWPTQKGLANVTR
jgi:hypothetical protein